MHATFGPATPQTRPPGPPSDDAVEDERGDEHEHQQAHDKPDGAAPEPCHQHRVTFFPSDWHSRNDISYVVANLIAMKDGTDRCGGLLLV